MTDLEASTVGEPPPPYMIFLLVFFFFITGLLGFLVCHLLKKKGYRCRTGEEEDEDEEECEQKLGPDKNAWGQAASSDNLSYVTDDEEGDHQDTVEQILKCIIENEANMEAFKEMLGKQDICEHHDPTLLRKESLGGIPPHHHTVHSGAQLDHKSCMLCVQGRTKKARRRSRVPRTNKPRTPGERRESTVFAVGRFRVTHMDKKDQGSGDQLDQSEALDSEKGDEEDPQRKEGYNLRSMFKDVKTDSTNGVVPIAAKRKKSLVLFSPRRGSDPVGAKVPLSQPMVEEEPLFTAPVKTAPVQTSSPVKILSSQPSLDSGAPDDTDMAPVKMYPTRVTFVVSPTESPVPVTPNASPGGVSPLTPPMQDSPTTPVQVTPMTPEILPLTQGSYNNPSVSALNVSLTPTPVQASPTSNLLNVSPDLSSRKVFPSPTPLNVSPTPSPIQVSPGLSSRKVFPSSSPLNVSPAPTPLNLSPASTPLMVSPTTLPRSILKNTTTFVKVDETSPTTKGPEDKVESLATVRADKVSPTAVPVKVCPTVDPMKVSPTSTSVKISPTSGGPLEDKLEVGSVTIVKASPDSQMEFSVVRTAEVRKEEEEEDPAVAQSPPEKGKDDEVEMEDIKDCRVSQEEGVSLEEKRRSVHSQHKW
ncbi:nascent polypeptide-associated complex subunit alpha, muscle-specific form-like isoform X1 [Salvelinus fontinalis]|uniref:nascent polypeptide-associated complex subunit alpha, muscle-specific form-like isoform X1 n=1 Tax=Salvelinus fontinalis TaxID=8038 RepID=UPI0024860877|nr:nascent polypeptide-associated complex subunit alpha, muscle-specific form-like isoform X1 [Salvelinus fontinalis]